MRGELYLLRRMKDSVKDFAGSAFYESTCRHGLLRLKFLLTAKLAKNRR